MLQAKKVLVVEDNELNLKLFLLTLRPVDAEILVARNGFEALDQIFGAKPDLVILDIQIPGVSGIDVAQQVRAHPSFADLPILAVTAYSMTGDKEKILAAGCTYYISKPIDTRAFPSIVQAILNGETPAL